MLEICVLYLKSWIKIYGHQTDFSTGKFYGKNVKREMTEEKLENLLALKSLETLRGSVMGRHFTQLPGGDRFLNTPPLPACWPNH